MRSAIAGHVLGPDTVSLWIATKVGKLCLAVTTNLVTDLVTLAQQQVISLSSHVCFTCV